MLPDNPRIFVGADMDFQLSGQLGSSIIAVSGDEQ